MQSIHQFQALTFFAVTCILILYMGAQAKSIQTDPIYGPYFEGDIRINPLDRSYGGSRWPDKNIYYTVDRTFSNEHKNLISNSLQEIEDRTQKCLKFHFFTGNAPTDYIYYTKIDEYCWSSVGYSGGEHIINLGSGCMSTGTIQHETLHTLGFWHEQSRSDRDDYVEIVWKHVIPGLYGQFTKRTTENFGTPYDYKSIMHYGPHAFAKVSGRNREWSIIPKGKMFIRMWWERFEMMGTREISYYDEVELKKAYSC